MRRGMGIPVPAGASPELVEFAKAVEQWILDRDKEPRVVPAFTLAELATLDPAAWVNGVVICTDESGGRCLADSDGTQWAHCTDGAAVS